MNKIVVLYGTETFNSYEYAVLLANRLEANSYEAVVYSMDDFPLRKLLETKIIIFVASTFGNGDNPKNTKKFWRFLLQRKLPRNEFLDHIEFSTFGLGDSSYPRYNFFIRKLHSRLRQLGAKEISPRGEGDEQSPEGVEAFYKEWEDSLINNIITKYPMISKTPKMNEDYIAPPKYRVEVETNRPKRKTDVNIQDVSNTRFIGPSNDDEEIRLGEVQCNDRLTSEDHFQDVRHFTIKDINGAIQYNSGDIISLYPSNSVDDVNQLLESQGWEEIADYKIKISQDTEEYKLNIEGGLVQPLTLRSLITHHLDIMSIPRRSFFMSIYKFASDEREREKLQEFSQLEFTEDLYNYADRPRRSILETVTEFFSLKIPVAHVLDIFPILRPRLFSIASALSSFPESNSFDLCVAIVKYKTLLKRIRKGVCTTWLKDLAPGTKILYSIKKNDVYSKFKDDSPLILIGPGTGIAPVRSIIQDKLSSDTAMCVFSGNRYKNKDYLYGEYFEKLEQQNATTLKVFPSFSRDDTLYDGNKKIKYVQDMLYYNKEVIYDMLMNRDGIIYLCGSSGKMPIQTRITIVSIIEECGKISKQEAEKVLLDFENEYRYLQETW
ncbi:NAPDH-dependent diflavin reductase [Saccharomycopsis crataegensis]|uniref:NADPH-dependent diflavin oxidoreductase 1 n=1 Tax=Saccharomycopsis crataegensis TaxID=43959 RepID=A0AAV5QWV3_9ASCO|nr:NAPDH-dependent diflavin reductase [Saccharomycopsis crataegensis]